MKKIRVLHIISGLGDGGAQRVILNYLNDFREDGIIDASLLVLNNTMNLKYKEEIEKNNYNIVYLKNDKVKTKRLFSKVKSLFSIQEKIDKVLKQIKPDIVHVHLYGTMLFSLNPIIKNNIPVRIYSIHSNPFRFKGIKLKVLRKAFSKGNFKAICLTKEQVMIAKKQYNIKEFEVIHNGVDFKTIQSNIIDKQSARNKFSLKDDDYIVCAVGRLEKIKNYEFLINLFSKVVLKNKNAKLIFAGDGSEFERLKNLCRKLNITENVIFLGNVANVVDLYCAADIMVMTSFSEASPLVLLEAQACEVPCVISNGVPSESIITNNVKKMSENATEDEWVTAVLKNDFKGEKVCSFDDYEVHSVSNKMKNAYIKYWEEYNSGKK